jgi:hypothetical protein
VRAENFQSLLIKVANEVKLRFVLLLKDLKQMKFVFERKFFAERRKNLEQSEKFILLIISYGCIE